MPELASKAIPLVRSLDSDINRIVKEFTSNFKNRCTQAPPDSYRRLESDGNDSLDSMGAVEEN